MKGRLKKYAVISCIAGAFIALAFFMVVISAVTEVISGSLSETDGEGQPIQITGVIDGAEAEFNITGAVEISGLKPPDNVEIDDDTIKLNYSEEDSDTQIGAVTSVDLTGTMEDGACSFKGKINGMDVAATGTVTIEDGKITIAASGRWERSDFGTGAYSGGKMAWPAPKGLIVTSPFGYRTDPIGGYTAFHSGVDLAGGGCYGTPIVAADDGKVISSGWNGGYGNCIIIDHGGGYTTLYAHASSLTAKAGQNVIRGERIALIGSTGYSTGPHLHFEVRINGNYQDPLPYIKGNE